MAPQQPQWMPSFANATYVASQYQQNAQQVSYPPDQSSNRQPQSQSIPGSYQSGSFTSPPGYPVANQQQPVLPSHPVYGHPSTLAYGATYQQPGVPVPHNQYTLLRSTSSEDVCTDFASSTQGRYFAQRRHSHGTQIRFVRLPHPCER